MTWESPLYRSKSPGNPWSRGRTEPDGILGPGMLPELIAFPRPSLSMHSMLPEITRTPYNMGHSFQMTVSGYTKSRAARALRRVVRNLELAPARLWIGLSPKSSRIKEPPIQSSSTIQASTDTASAFVEPFGGVAFGRHCCDMLRLPLGGVSP